MDWYGLKTGDGEGQPKERRENELMRKDLKQGAGWANQRKNKQTNGLVGAQTGVRVGQTKEKRENKWISRG